MDALEAFVIHFTCRYNIKSIKRIFLWPHLLTPLTSIDDSAYLRVDIEEFHTNLRLVHSHLPHDLCVKTFPA
jgi:hypothetical protein